MARSQAVDLTYLRKAILSKALASRRRTCWPGSPAAVEFAFALHMGAGSTARDPGVTTTASPVAAKRDIRTPGIPLAPMICTRARREHAELCRKCGSWSLAQCRKQAGRWNSDHGACPFMNGHAPWAAARPTHSVSGKALSITLRDQYGSNVSSILHAQPQEAIKPAACLDGRRCLCSAKAPAISRGISSMWAGCARLLWHGLALSSSWATHQHAHAQPDGMKNMRTSLQDPPCPTRPALTCRPCSALRQIAGPCSAVPDVTYG